MSLPKTLDQALYAPGYVCQTVDTFRDLLELQRLEPHRFPHLLESVAHGTAQARFDILFAFPEYSVSLKTDGQLLCEGDIAASGDFLRALDALWHRSAWPPPATVQSVDMPFRGGWFVYLGYELVTQIEPRLAHIPMDSALPVARLTRIPAAIIRDHASRRTHLVCESDRAPVLLPRMRSDLERRGHIDAQELKVIDLQEQDAQIFLDGVQQTLAYIRAGDVFQVNLSRFWRATLDTTVSPAAVYERLRRANPAPFAGLMTLGDGSAVISSSPERLVRVQGPQISTRPIADRKSTRLNSSHSQQSRMPSSA